MGEYFFQYGFKNNSNQTITVCWGTEIIYPDTTLYFDRRDNIIEAQRGWGFAERCKSDEDFMSNFPLDTLSIFVFSVDTINKYGWDKVQEDYMVLRRYDLCLQNFRDLDWIITYPPDERMKNIKMYPPYSD